MSHSSSDVEVFLDAIHEFGWNALVERFEPPFRIRKRVPELQEKLADSLSYALRTGGQAQLSQADHCEDLDVLKAFRRLSKHSAEEYVVVALSAPNDATFFVSLFAAMGTATRVTIPQSALRQVRLRLTERVPTRVLYIHNHPRGILHDIFGLDALGPSTRDRDILVSEYRRWLDTNGLIQSDFYLSEGRYFRKFIVPSATDAWRVVQQFLSVK